MGVLKGQPHGQAADNEPLSRADKARGISQKYSHPNIHHYIIGGGKSQARSIGLFYRRNDTRQAEHINIIVCPCNTLMLLSRYDGFIAISPGRRVP